ncbi:hypothetical protein MBLNU230_g8470t1 [Neophaeotheca triangularis]
MPYHPLTLEPDRELVLVPKKGRPVTQCQHCRIERKKRSAHVKCDCGEADKPHHPKEKCIHLREAEERIKQGLPSDPPEEKDKDHLASVAEEQGCCCHHGGKCSCAIKKEPDNDGSLPHGKPAVSKPRLESTKSDGHITVFSNGHHKPVHRKNNAAHEGAMPYKMPMPRAHTTENMSNRRSIDDMGLNQSSTCGISGDKAALSMPFDMGRRKSKSEQTSPKLPPLDTNSAWPFGLMSGSLPQSELDFSNNMQGTTDFATAFGCPSFSYTADNTFGPASGTADSQYDPWSALGSGDQTNMPNTNPFDVWPTSQDATNLLVQPALTAASSGNSEVDETPPIDESYGTWHMPSIQEDVSGFNMNEPYLSNSEANNNRHSLPPSFFGNANLGFLSQTSDPPSTTSFAPYNNSKTNTFDQDLGMPNLDDIWNMPTLPPSAQIPHRLRQSQNTPKRPGSNNSSGNSRPTARSVGPSSAPNNDVMRELFPELDDDDLNGAPNGLSSTTSMSQTSSTGFGYGSGDEGNAGFGSQTSWLSNDPYQGAYEVDAGYSTQGSGTGWS